MTYDIQYVCFLYLGQAMNCMCYCRTLLAGSGLPKMACCKINGYQANLHTIEVGSRGFLHPQSFLDLYKIVKTDSIPDSLQLQLTTRLPFCHFVCLWFYCLLLSLPGKDLFYTGSHSVCTVQNSQFFSSI